MENIEIKKEVEQKQQGQNMLIDLANGNKLSKSDLLFMLRQTFPALNKYEFKYAIMTCQAYGLDPRKKEIYFVPFAGKNGNTIASITSYEVYSNMLNEGGYTIINDWKGDDTMDYTNLMIKANVFKNGQKVYNTPWISIKEHAKMNYEKTELVGLWKQLPTLMLEKCVLVRIARMLCGKNMGYIAEEMYNAKQYDQTEINKISQDSLKLGENK